MKLQIKTKNLDLTNPMREFIETKIGALAKFIQSFERERDVLVEVEIARPSHHHNKGRVYYAEANMQLPGKLLRAESEDFDVRLAVKSVKDILQREIRKYKTELRDK